MDEKSTSVLLPQLLREEEVASVLAVSTKTVERHWQEWGLGRLHLTKDWRSVRYLAKDVERFIRERVAQEEKEACPAG